MIMTTTRKVFRSITLGLFILAILAYYLPSLFNGGHFGVAWLAIGVAHTAAFCAIFFRDSRTRTGLSIALMVISTLWSFVLLLAIGLLALVLMELGVSMPMAFVYLLCSMLAGIFALCFPRKYIQNVTI